MTDEESAEIDALIVMIDEETIALKMRELKERVKELEVRTGLVVNPETRNY